MAIHQGRPIGIALTLVLLLALMTGPATAGELGELCAKATGSAPDDKLCACLDDKAAGDTRADLLTYFQAIKEVSDGAPPLDPEGPVSKKGQKALAGSEVAMNCAMESVK
jgi:hypothetical protein